MSMNIRVSFKGVPLDIGLLQTPTDITYEIISSTNPLEEYLKFAEKIFNDQNSFNKHKEYVTECIKSIGENEVEWNFV